MVAPQEAQAYVRGGLIDTVRADGLGDAFSGFEGEACIGCAGIRPLWRGVGEAWAYLSPAALARPIALTRAAKRGLEAALSDGGMWRVQCVVRRGHVAAHEWAAFLGFEVEGLMTAYGPDGEDFFMYARVNR